MDHDVRQVLRAQLPRHGRHRDTFDAMDFHHEIRLHYPHSLYGGVLYRGPRASRFLFYTVEQWYHVAVEFIDERMVTAALVSLAMARIERKTICVFCWVLIDGDNDNGYRTALQWLCDLPPPLQTDNNNATATTTTTTTLSN